MTEVPRGILDPTTMGEDLPGNARRATQLAPRLCEGCANYHVIFTVERLTNRPTGIDADRAHLIELVGRLAVERLAARTDTIEVVIVGSSDTGVLATCAHAVALHAGSAASRVRYTVLDLCPTPLELCRDYAARHGIAVTVRAVDLVATGETFPADLIVHHSLFNFLPENARPATLAKFGRWLKPDGRIVFSISVKPTTVELELGRMSERARVLKDEIESGRVVIYEPADAFAGRLAARTAERAQRETDFSNVEQVRELFNRAGQPVLGFETFDRSSAGPGGARRVRVVATLGAARTQG